ncbi:MAG TPA: DUF3016 domain-containing protein [Usitatibacter sp.]|jgi:hypothetical protein|nr:DUF3016 domain-containing protein [Usitatibacter sp.]
MLSGSFLRRVALLPLACAALSAAAATAHVEFVKPESFTDAGRGYAGAEREENLQRLAKHIGAEAGKRLPAGENLEVWVTDVDLAGYYDPRQGFTHEVRIVKDFYPPRIALRFRLTRTDGSVVKEGERRLVDPNFLSRAQRYPLDGLGYEKTLLDRWLHSEFTPG